MIYPSGMRHGGRHAVSYAVTCFTGLLKLLNALALVKLNIHSQQKKRQLR
jgi:hypothetical protein